MSDLDEFIATYLEKGKGIMWRYANAYLAHIISYHMQRDVSRVELVEAMVKAGFRYRSKGYDYHWNLDYKHFRLLQKIYVEMGGCMF